jgi:hypothetical protein
MACHGDEVLTVAKRSKQEGVTEFKRVEGDFYATTPAAVSPLFRFLPPKTKFSEPCAGAGDLVDLLTAQGHECVSKFDTAPRRADILQGDALSALHPIDFKNPQKIITNPPWKREALHPMILRFMEIAPTWLLFDIDWASCKQAAPFLKNCVTILAIGRVSWFGGSGGMDNVAWYEFNADHTAGPHFINKWAYL